MTSLARFPFFAMKNKSIINLSTQVGCFHCEKIVDKSKIEKYTDSGQTAICPLCHVDSLIGDACGIEVNQDILAQAHKFWYKK